MESRIKQKTTMYTNEETFTLLSGGIAQPGGGYNQYKTLARDISNCIILPSTFYQMVK